LLIDTSLQALSRVLPLRNFFLLPQNYEHCRSLLVQRFGEVLRKTCNPRNFKGQVLVLHKFIAMA
jgi:U4/U6.U5 tri-snRNP-associated protein 2